MRIYSKFLIIKRLLIFASIIFFAPLLKAQFTITENFKGSSVASNIVLGGDPNPASLTSGVFDPINNGWLRLTNDATDQRGYSYINTPFPSTLGIYIEFEYKTWRTRNDTYHGADGFSVFLLDANTSPFRIGGFGGSLGYAQRNAEQGLAGAYLGIGFDEYGNFAIASEGKKGGAGGTTVLPNSIVLRGPANHADPYRYLTSVKLGANAPVNGVTSIDYNTSTATRPTDDNFFRRVRIYIEPIGVPGSPKYRIRVLWRTSPTGADTELLSYETTDEIPAMLKLGFGASTGGGFNYHEIRNLLITTTGGVRVKKEVDKVNALPGEELKYIINVYNEAATHVSNLVVNDIFEDQESDPIDLSDFHISSILFDNNGKTGNIATGFTSGTAKTTGFSNPFSTTLALEAGGVATFTITGTVQSALAGKDLHNSVELDVSNLIGFVDTDLTNNFSTVSTTILNPNVDLKIEKGVDNSGIAISTGNTFTIVVSNVSSVQKPAGVQVKVTDVIPAGLTFVNSTHSGWSRTNSGSTYTFTRTDALNGQYAYPPITIKVTPTGTGPWTNTANLTYVDDTNLDNNSSSVALSWVNYWHGTYDTDWSKTSNWTANFIPDSGEDIEFATVTNNGPTGNGNGKGAAINDLHLDTDRIIGDLINKSSKDLIVTTENQIIINGQVKGDNSGGIVINTAHDKASGTLIFKKPVYNSNANAIVQFYNKAYQRDNCGFYRRQWQYFGIPVKSATFPYANVAGDETVNMWDEPFNGDKWRPVAAGTLEAFKGYQITNNSTTLPTDVYNFDGILNVNDANVGLTNTASVNYSGTNLVSNSFTAAIPISATAMTFPSGAEQTVYLFNTGTRDQWRKLNGAVIDQEGYRMGQYLAVPVNLGGTAHFPDRIPSSHAFLVQTTTNGNLKINYSSLTKNTSVNLGNVGETQITTRTTSNSNTSVSETSNANVQFPYLVIDVIGENSADRLWIFQKHNATHHFDNGWDGHKLIEEGVAQLYVNTLNNSKLQVATVPELNGVSVGFVPDSYGKFTLDFSLWGRLKGDDIYLHDAVTGTTERVGDGHSYSFESNKGDSANRFSLTYTHKNRFLSVGESLIEVFAIEGGSIIVTNDSNKACQAAVYDSNGTFVQRLQVSAKGKVTIANLAKGAYMVRLQNSEINDVRRVMIK